MRLAATLTAALLTVSTAHAQGQEKAADFYKDNRLLILVGSSPGGGYDTLARLMSRHWGRHVPGSPNMVVQNMPGAGSLNMTNHVYTVAPRDGSVVGLGNNAMPIAPVLYPSSARFDPSRFSWIGGPSKDAMVVAVWHTAPVQTIDDLFTKEVVVGGEGRGSAPVDYAIVANQVLGTKFKLVSGYKGTTDTDLAMQRGEVQGNAGLGWVSAKVRNADLIASGKMRIVAQYGFKPHPDLPNVPLFKLPDSEADRQILKILYARDETGRPFFAPPDIPADRLSALRTSFEATLKDKQFLDEAEKLKVAINPVSWQQLEELANGLSQIPPEVAERVRKMLN